MADQTSGLGASVGVKKRDEDGEVVDTAGDVDESFSRSAWVTFFTMLILSMFGMWKVAELIMMLI